MGFVELLKTEAERRGELEAGAEVDAAAAFRLVRDMTYQRASDRRPETLIREWRGTCSGKHYLLQGLFQELGYRARVMACTHNIAIAPEEADPALRAILAEGGGEIVDVHNYILLGLPEGGEMIVDATWPLSTAAHGFPANAEFVLGQDQRIAAKALETWEVPAGEDPQAFKQALLEAHFTPAELERRERFIKTLGRLMAGAGGSE